MSTATLFDMAPEQSYAEVAVPVPTGEVFTYAVPDHIAAMVLPGSRVVVPFSGRRLIGVVVATRSRPPADLEASRIRPLSDCLDPTPLLPPVLLALTHWVAEETMSSWGETLRSALPTGLHRVGRRRIALTEEGAGAAEPASEDGSTRQPPADPEADLMAALAGSRNGRMTMSALAKRVAVRDICARSYGLARRGLVEVDDEWHSGAGGRWLDMVRRARHVSPETALERTARAPAQRRVVDWLERTGEPVAVERLCADAECSRAVVRALAGKGLIEVRREPVGGPGSSAWTGGADGAGSFRLSRAQRAALDRIGADTGAFRSVLLHGVTGSGKTEVYLRASRDVVQQGRTAILLVPEIGLTPLLAHRARAVFGEAVAVMHSGMSDGERLSAWWRARTGLARVIVGPRSAIFAPLDNVGLIVVDEEQDGAYKQDEAPRYHGRDVALTRGRLEGAIVVMGSATPALETFFGVSTGRSEVASMPERVTARPLPAVEVVDMRAEWRANGRTMVSERLEQAIDECLRRGEQALLLLNRRGFAASLLCRACGERMACPDCSVSLTLHRPQRLLHCHYCDHRRPVPPACPVCGADALQEIGHGTQRLQSALKQRFPKARMRRFDADETRRRGAHTEILSQFARGELDVLVGTQMLAKGHDFPGVTMVGAVGADDALGLPDFRAAERTFQLLTQVAGRAGRGEVAGTVVLQAVAPDHYAIRAAVEHDYRQFYDHEIEYRRRLSYPPFRFLIACTCRGKSSIVVKEEADRLAAGLRDIASTDVQVLGPASPPLARLRGLHRLQLIIKGTDRVALRDTLTEAVRRCRQQGGAPRDLRIDVDPLSLM